MLNAFSVVSCPNFCWIMMLFTLNCLLSHLKIEQTIQKSLFKMIFSCRFLFGGEHGRLKYSPPENFSPLYECLLPNQSLYIDPGFYFGELHKTILSGRLPVEDNVAFVPNPVDTTTVILIQRKLFKINFLFIAKWMVCIKLWINLQVLGTWKVPENSS